MPRPTPWSLFPLIVASGAACSVFEPTKPPPQEIIVRVSGDPGRPLEGASILHSGKKVSVTGPDGVGKLKLNGKDGETFDFVVSCPEGFQSPSKPLNVILRRLADPTKVPEYEVACPPTTRSVVVAVRAENGPNLPVLHLGREIARTDGSGAATVLLKLKSDEAFDLSLGTTEKGGERLKPQNPYASFVVKDRDDVFVFDQKFEVEKKRFTGGGGRRIGPVKIGH